jgi:hypothetical protein
VLDYLTHVSACSLSALPVFLETNAIALAVIKVAGIPIATDILTHLILGQAANSDCEFPEHSHPACLPEGDGAWGDVVEHKKNEDDEAYYVGKV